MAYSPQLKTEYSRTLRRIAWALKKPMTTASEDMISYMAAHMDRESICRACRDKTKCSSCFFAGDTERREANNINALLKT